MDNFFGLDKVGSHPDNSELLITVNDNVQLSIIESILKSPISSRKEESAPL